MPVLHAPARVRLGARPVDPSAWEELGGMSGPKEAVERRVMLPLRERGLAARHGVCPPGSILLFGPPGTGKSRLAAAVAGGLGWALVEPDLSLLAGNAARVRQLFEQVLELEAAVVLLDEFEHLGLRRDGAGSPHEPVTAELLRGLSGLRGNGRVVALCATNHVRLLDPAVLRPGRFDLVLPVGPPDAAGRRTVLDGLLAGRPCGSVDLAAVVERSDGLTAADLELVCERAAAAAFEREARGRRASRIETADLLGALASCRPTLDPEEAAEFHDDAVRYRRS